MTQRLALEIGSAVFFWYHMRRKAKVDRNHDEIRKAFKKLGYSWADTSGVGEGFPDGVAGKFGKNYLIEIKDGMKPPSARKLTDPQEKFWAEWLGSIVLIQSVQDVIEFDKKRSGSLQKA